MTSLFNYYYMKVKRDATPQEKAAASLDRLNFLAEAYERQSRQERQSPRLAQRFTQPRQ